MNLTSGARKNFVAELVAFETAATEAKNRFYDFLVAHDPKGYAEYRIFPFVDSTVPLWKGYFNLVPYVEDVRFDERTAEPSDVLVFKGPLSEVEIRLAREAAEMTRDIYESENSPFIHNTQNVWNTQELYIHVPDAYLDDPDGWEASVLTSMSADRELAQNALETLYGVEATTLGFEVARKGPEENHDYIEVKLNSSDMQESHWENFKLTSKGETPLLFVSHKTGHIFDTKVPWKGYEAPEKEARTFMGTTATVAGP